MHVIMQNTYQSKEGTMKLSKFSMSLFFMAGPAAYEMLHQNLPEALPSLSLVKKEMRKHYSNFTEGVFRFDKLSVHLDAYQAPRVVFNL